MPAGRSGDAVRLFLLGGLVGAVEGKAVRCGVNTQHCAALQVHRGGVTLLTSRAQCLLAGELEGHVAPELR